MASSSNDDWQSMNISPKLAEDRSLEEAVGELLSNAIHAVKDEETGTVDTKKVKYSSTLQNDEVIIVIEDEGSGMNEDAFIMGHNAQGHHGCGLKDAISKICNSTVGGTIEIESCKKNFEFSLGKSEHGTDIIRYKASRRTREKGTKITISRLKSSEKTLLEKAKKNHVLLAGYECVSKCDYKEKEDKKKDGILAIHMYETTGESENNGLTGKIYINGVLTKFSTHLKYTYDIVVEATKEFKDRNHNVSKATTPIKNAIFKAYSGYVLLSDTPQNDNAPEAKFSGASSRPVGHEEQKESNSPIVEQQIKWIIHIDAENRAEALQTVHDIVPIGKGSIELVAYASSKWSQYDSYEDLKKIEWKKASSSEKNAADVLILLQMSKMARKDVVQVILSEDSIFKSTESAFKDSKLDGEAYVFERAADFLKFYRSKTGKVSN